MHANAECMMALRVHAERGIEAKIDSSFLTKITAEIKGGVQDHNNVINAPQLSI